MNVLRWLRKQNTITSIRITLDRLYLLDELVSRGEFKNRSQTIETAIDELLKRYYGDEEEITKLSDFVRADLLREADA